VEIRTLNYISLLLATVRARLSRADIQTMRTARVAASPITSPLMLLTPDNLDLWPFKLIIGGTPVTPAQRSAVQQMWSAVGTVLTVYCHSRRCNRRLCGRICLPHCKGQAVWVIGVQNLSILVHIFLSVEWNEILRSDQNREDL